MVWPSGSGKSTFARTHFAPTEVLSSDRCRGLVRDDENDPDGPTITTSDSCGIFSSATVKYPHLGRRARHRIVRPDGKEADGVLEACGLLGRPAFELGARPFEAMVAMTEAAGGQAREVDVVLDVRRGDHHRARPRAFDHGAGEGAQPGGIQVV